MFQAYLWPLAGGTVAVAALRCLTLFVGLRLALRGAPRADRLGFFTEFARALSLKSRPEERGGETPLASPAATDRHTLRRHAAGRCRR